MKSQIDKRKDVRAKQIEERARKQQEKMEREKVCPHQGSKNDGVRLGIRGERQTEDFLLVRRPMLIFSNLDPL